MVETAKKSAAKKAPAKRTAAKTAAPAKKTAAKTAAPAKKENTVAKKKLKVGESVNVRVEARQNGGENVAAGVVTKTGDETVNIKVFLDSEENQWVQNVAVVASEPKDDESTGRVCWPA